MIRLFRLIVSAFRSNHNHGDYRLPPSLSDDDDNDDSFDHSVGESSSLLQYNINSCSNIIVDVDDIKKTIPIYAAVDSDNKIENSIINSNFSQITNDNFDKKMSSNDHHHHNNNHNNHQNSDSSNR